VLNADPIRSELKQYDTKPPDVEVVSPAGLQGWSEAMPEPPSTILVVDDRDVSLTELCALLDGEGYRVLTARPAGMALEILRRSRIDLVILDMALPGISGLDFCRRIRADRRTELTQMLIVSDVEPGGHEIACIASGGDAYLTRPYQPEALFVRVRSLLRRKASMNRLEESETVLMALAQAIAQRDSLTAGHGDRLAALAVAMGLAMQLPAHNLLALHRGGYLHDIGKIGMPDSILFKKGPLNDEEWRLMRTHTIKGEAICRPIKCLAPVLPIVRSHHERWDGSGYPDGLAGQNIPLLARVLQLADVYDALTSERSYKSAMISSHVLRLMQEETARGWYDPELMRLFLGLRHENLRDAAGRYAEEWQDLQVMKDSLENLLLSVQVQQPAPAAIPCTARAPRRAR
jgi:putative two-component system response regulator